MKHSGEGLARTIARLRELEAAATPGPWTVLGSGDDTWVTELSFGYDAELPEADSTFIAEMRNALPVLLHELEQRDARVEALLDRLAFLEERNAKLEAVAEAAQHFINHRNTPTEDYHYNCGVAECDLEDALAELEGEKE